MSSFFSFFNFLNFDFLQKLMMTYRLKSIFCQELVSFSFKFVCYIYMTH